MGWILLWWGLLDSYLDRKKVRRRIDGDKRVLLCILHCHKRLRGFEEKGERILKTSYMKASFQLPRSVPLSARPLSAMESGANSSCQKCRANWTNERLGVAIAKS